MKRVVIGSFGVSMLLGAIYLGAVAISNLRVRCEDGGHAECAFIEQTAHENGRTQALGATGCALVGGGLLLFLRSSHKEA
jgi:hypothetical protein